MTKTLRLAFAGAVALCAAAQVQAAQGVAKLTDAQLDQIVAGDEPLLMVNVATDISLKLEPVTVSVDVAIPVDLDLDLDIPVNVAAVVQANVLGKSSMEAVAVGTQNNTIMNPTTSPIEPANMISPGGTSAVGAMGPLG